MAAHRVILHVDMDAFFTSVEQRDFPEIRGKPVVVGADPKAGKGRGVVAAASYEARRFGIHSAQPISRAYALCPHAVFLRGRYDRYEEVSASILSAFRGFTPIVEPVSLDEAFLDATGTERLFGKPEQLARTVKEAVFKKERLTASVGVGPNKLIAKIASDLKKPDGLVVVRPEQARSFLEPLPVSKIGGIGKKTEERLLSLGIRTAGELARYSRDALEDAFGKTGRLLWEYANGIDDDPVSAGREAKSISNETTFDEDQDSPDILRKTLLDLAEKVGCRLRGEGMAARTVFVKVRIKDFSTQVRRTSQPEPFQLSETLFHKALALFRSCDLKGQKVRLLGVGVSQLIRSDEVQTDLFPSGDEEKRVRASAAADRIKKQFGNGSIRKGG